MTGSVQGARIVKSPATNSNARMIIGLRQGWPDP